MKTKNENRIIPKRNYIIFLVLVIFTVALTLLFSNWYNSMQDLNKKDTIMSEFLVGINEEEFENYIVENNSVIIYLASSKDESLNEFESELKELVIEYGLDTQMIFFDLENIEEEFLTELKNKYFADNIKNINMGNYTNILIMENGKITSVLYNKETLVNISDVEEFFYARGVVGQA